MYHPPNQGCLPNSFLDLAEANVPCLLVGDLNAKHASWGCSVNNSRGNDLLYAADDRALLFLNDGSPTHHSFSYNTAEALDISLASADVYPFCHWSVLGNIGSDHLPIKIELKMSQKKLLSKEKFWNFKKADWRAYAELTEKDFSSLRPSRQLNETWLNFREVVVRNAKKTIPRGNFKRLKATYLHNDPCIRPLVDKRDRLYQELKKNNSDSIRAEFNKTNAEIKRLYAVKKRTSWYEFCSKIDARTNNSKLWNIAKSLSRDQPQAEVCNAIFTTDGSPPHDDRATANILGSHYQRMSRLTFNKADKHTERQAKKAIHKCRSSDLGDPVFMADFSMQELLFALNDFDSTKSPGPDNIHGEMIIHLGPSGTKYLLDMFNQSWKSGRLPHEWKKATIIPIRKPGKLISSPESYRPIALTSLPCKIMERLILRRLSYFLDNNDLMPEEQYGFRRGYSTEDQILYFCQSVRDAQNLKPTNHTVAAFLDLSKAFDTVWRNKLILKMFEKFEIKGRALPWISDFLKSRVIRVKYNKTLSKDFKISQGVPQGSVLSPTLFSMFMAGVEKVATGGSSIGLFADDIVLWHSGHDVLPTEAILSQSLDKVGDFATDHKLSFNLTKSVASFFTTNRHLFNYKPTVSIKGQELPYEKHPKYLGFTLDQEIHCNRHIEDLVSKSRKRLNLLKYISGRDWGANASTLKVTYTALIRPILEYGSAIFSSASYANLKKLERIQQSAARIIAGLRNSCPISLALYECDLQPLEMRRKYCLTKYYNKLLSYGDQHRTSQYLKSWNNNQRLKRNSPFSQALKQNLVCPNVEPYCLTPLIDPVHGLQGVTFHPNLSPDVNKKSDHPDMLKQLALETIGRIPLDGVKIYTDGSRLESNTTGSGVFIELPNRSIKFQKRNADHASVFRSELIAIMSGLSLLSNITEENAISEIWILSDSRSSIQHLSNWPFIGDCTSRTILQLLKALSDRHPIHLQWVPSHVGLPGNEVADDLAKAAASDPVDPEDPMPLSSNEIFSMARELVCKSWAEPPSHPWYFQKHPGAAITSRASRVHQTAFSRFSTGHLRCIAFEGGERTFPPCPKCDVGPSSPQHILQCLGFSCEEAAADPRLFMDFLNNFGLMDLV